ncbi:hypothetical protein EYC80_000708 [Monilinia laxa]|uniref:Uncharacterized protein n=1 Tax=Monilinia laxa TaxID=61186 RepID=A0A5N6KBK9_MONLA|nr:hypothetical protein EYC80_000708 [Monilinia laxa]
MTSTILGIDHILLGVQELLFAIPHLMRPVLLTFTLFFTVCIFMCAVASAFIAMKSSLSMVVKDSDDMCSEWMRKIVASDEFIGMGVLGYVVVVAFGVGRGLDLVLGRKITEGNELFCAEKVKLQVNLKSETFILQKILPKYVRTPIDKVNERLSLESLQKNTLASFCAGPILSSQPD